MTRRTIQITVESKQILIMRQRRNHKKCWCDVCGQQVEMLLIGEARAIADFRTAYGEVESEGLHLVKTPSGVTFVCLNSLVAPG